MRAELAGAGQAISLEREREKAYTDRPLEIPDQLGGLRERSEQLNKGLAELEARLQGVLRPVPPAPSTTQNGKANPCICPAATEIGARIYRTSEITEDSINRVRILLDRLEL